MAAKTETIRGPKLLKIWNSWEAGIGHLVDDGVTPGMYYASGLLGLKQELRAAPLINTATILETMIRTANNVTSKDWAIAVVGLTPISAGTVTFDAASSGETSAAGTSLTFAHECTGSNRYLVVGVSTTGTADPTGVTYDGVAMTKLDSAIKTDVTVSIWGLAAPTTGSDNVVVTMAGSTNIIIGGAVSWTDTSQTNPSGTALATDTGTTGNAAIKQAHYMAAVEVPDNGKVIGVSVLNSPDDTIGSLETSRWDRTVIEGADEIYALGSTRAPLSSFRVQYFAEEAATSDSTIPYLYVSRGNGTNAVRLTKIRIDNTNFGVGQGEHQFAGLTKSGQMARYQGNWYFPMALLASSRKLATVAAGLTGQDDLNETISHSVATEDHLANIGHQLFGHRQASGVRILKVDGTPSTEADWGAYFPVGDKNERAAGLRGLGGLAFVMNPEGLFSFNTAGRSGLVFEDFRSWRSVFDNIPISAWRGGLLIPHPSGLLYYSVGSLPINIGVDSNPNLGAVPPSGPTELHGGRHHGTAPLGDFVWALYQPDVTSTTALILCGYSLRSIPNKLVWQSVGTTTLNANNAMSGCYVATKSEPVTSNVATPTVFFGDGRHLGYVVLDPRASPFRSRADTHKITTSADAYMSEIFFDEPTDLTHLIVHTQDMASGDKWQISGIADNSTDTNFGSPILTDNRTVLQVNKKNVSRFMLHVKWTATSNSDRVPPIIKRIELYGPPS